MGAALAAVVSSVLVGIGVGSAAGVEPVPQAAVVQPERVPVAAAPTSVSPTSVSPTAVSPSESQPTSAPRPTRDAAPQPTAGDADVAPPASIPVRSAAAAPEQVAGTPCTVTARACVDLAGRRAWLIQDGAILRTARSMMVGDEIDPTPLGTFQVEWKAEQWTSREYLTQMPYAVFFAEGGIAFHEGPQDTNSAGCVKLVNEDAVAWFDYLQVGDEVQVR